jgi:hypothetical protein
MNIRIIFLFLFLISLSQLSIARQDALVIDSTGASLRPINRDHWKSATKDLDYSKDRPEVERKEHKNYQLPVAGPVLKAILYILVFGLLIFVLYKVFGNSSFRGNKKVKQLQTFAVISPDEDIHAADLDKIFRDALVAGDYRLAIRACYLRLISELSSRKMIRWRKEKTNHQYLAELSANQLYAGFREITLLYERTWFGNDAVSEEGYRRIQPKFDDLITRIQRPAGSVVPKKESGVQ